MAPPQFLLDALDDSIGSGAFLDTKFYVFSCRDASGRVHSPRALYCNSRILDKVPYFSSLFSNAPIRDIDGGFPSDASPYSENHDYLSDDDLEDGSGSGKDEEEPREDDNGSPQCGFQDAEPITAQTAVSNSSLPCPLSVEIPEGQNDDTSRMGKVIIVQDVAALTFEALLYFSYTGEIEFAPPSSDPRHGLPAQKRGGDWKTGKLPSPSAKSVYRLADKYGIQPLKEKAKTYIRNNLDRYDIPEEIFSSFAYSFPEILSMQVSFLVNKMNEEAKWDVESTTRKRFRNKIASLSQSQLGGVIGTLAMIWNCIGGPLEPLEAPSKFNFSVMPTVPLNWHRLKLAFLKSITTGVFIDVQLHAYNQVFNNLPLNPKPLFASSVVLEEWGSIIATHTAGTNSQATCLADGIIDDYEEWDGEPPLGVHRNEVTLTYRTKAAPGKNREAALLVSGAWKTWKSLLSYAYGNEITFSPLQTSVNDSNLVAQADKLRSCSPRSVVSLATTLGIKDVQKVALKEIQSKLSASNIIPELFSSFAESHQAVMELEIEFLHKTIPGTAFKLVMGYIQSAASGESPFFPKTLSLVYDKLAERTSPVNPFFGSSQPSSITPSSSFLICARCRRRTPLEQLYGGLHCPSCTDNGRNGKGERGRPYMRCPGCSHLRVARVDHCSKAKCSTKFL